MDVLVLVQWNGSDEGFLQVGLANILDLYYEDQYSIPGKQLSCEFTADFSKVSKSKVPGYICINFLSHFSTLHIILGRANR